MKILTVALLSMLLPAAAPARDAEQRAVNLNDAAAACRNKDFASFFERFVWSPDVRRRYTAPTLLVGSIATPARPGMARPAAQHRFAIAMMDYRWVDAASADRWEKDGTPPRDIWTKQTPLKGGGWRVDYQNAITRPGEGDGVEIIRRIGMPRAYVFRPANGCWRLERWLK